MNRVEIKQICFSYHFLIPLHPLRCFAEGTVDDEHKPESPLIGLPPNIAGDNMFMQIQKCFQFWN